MKAALYLRGIDPDTGQTAGNQRPVLEQWAQKRGLEPGKVYEECESAWKAGHQAQLAQSVRYARSRRFQLVVAWALDRLSRLGPTEGT